MIDPQRLRDLADSLDECEWNHALGSAALCRAAADELDNMRATAIKALAVPAGNDNTTYGAFARDNPVLLLAESYKLAKEEYALQADELERLRFGLRVALCRVFHYAPRDVTDAFMADWLNLMAAKAAGGDA